MVGPQDNLPMRIEGLAEGTYRLVAMQEPQGDARALSSFTIVKVEAGTDAGVVLELVSNGATLSFKDRQGSPVRGIQIPRAREIEPGKFALAGIHGLEPILVRPQGYTPICKSAPRRR